MRKLSLIFSFGIVFTQALAWGAKTPSKHETYSATEGVTAADIAPKAPEAIEASVEQDPPAPKMKEEKSVGVPVIVAAPTAAPAPIQNIPLAEAQKDLSLMREQMRKSIRTEIDHSFDNVPTAQSDSILARLKIVEELIRLHGRAYDYRVLTTKQLQSTLDRLNAAQARASTLNAPADDDSF